jgi:predicted HTH transcriptional regulator
MRKCYEVRNFSGLLGLIEEAQTGANRMESALEDYNGLDSEWELDRVRDTIVALKKERRKLRVEVVKLKKEKEINKCE